MNVAWPVENLERKHLIAIPLIIAAFFGSVIAIHWYSTGEPVPLSMEFAGGSFVRIQNIRDLSSAEAENFQAGFQAKFGGETPKIHLVDQGMEIETSEDLLEVQENKTAEGEIRDLLKSSLEIETEPDIAIESMGSIITELYKKQARNAGIAAVIAMGVILFIALRRFPIVGGILSVVGLDFVGILGGMTILNIQLSLASMAGILLIFGYAVNTNILLSTSVLKRKGGTSRERAGRAMSTGIKMSSTSAVAMFSLYIITSAPELEQISAVLMIGILVDMVNTWLLNSGLILTHQKEKEEKYHGRI